MKHREEADLAIHLHWVAEFDEDYEGEEDGFAWRERVQGQLAPRLLAAVLETLRADPRWAVRHAPRGRAPESGFDVEIVRRFETAPAGKTRD